jgi:hypothetical protein
MPLTSSQCPFHLAVPLAMLPSPAKETLTLSSTEQ